jgi:hypothetical protein
MTPSGCLGQTEFGFCRTVLWGVRHGSGEHPRFDSVAGQRQATPPPEIGVSRGLTNGPGESRTGRMRSLIRGESDSDAMTRFVELTHDLRPMFFGRSRLANSRLAQLWEPGDYAAVAACGWGGSARAAKVILRPSSEYRAMMLRGAFGMLSVMVRSAFLVASVGMPARDYSERIISGVVEPRPYKALRARSPCRGAPRARPSIFFRTTPGSASGRCTS